jgi:hypothetical protein
MARTITKVDAYLDARRTRDWELIYKATKTEASRMVTELQKWENRQKATDYEWMVETYTDAGVFEAIHKASTYVWRIRNRNRNWSTEVGARNLAEALYMKAVQEGQPQDVLDGFKQQHADAKERLDEIEDEQFALARRVTKIYCGVGKTVVSLGGANPYNMAEDDEDDPSREFNYEDHITEL